MNSRTRAALLVVVALAVAWSGGVAVVGAQDAGTDRGTLDIARNGQSVDPRVHQTADGDIEVEGENGLDVETDGDRTEVESEG
jgi:hypothetical protein